MKMQNKLLPCPFCGGEVTPLFVDCSDGEVRVWDEGFEDADIYFHCYECDSNFYHDLATQKPQWQIEWWNKRVPMERIVEQLEELSLSYELNCHKMIRENKCHESEDCGICAFKQAIEIVRNGGKE
jgi:hypothetical protein